MRSAAEPDPCFTPKTDFYRDVLGILETANLPHLVGGAFAIGYYTGIIWQTKDLDVFIRRSDLEPIQQALTDAGYRCAVVFPHWLAKVYSQNHDHVDIIFSSGNGLCVVDDDWFRHARRRVVAGHSVLFCPPEELIWSKAFVMERERFDGADVLHLLLQGVASIDWGRLLARFGSHWRVLFAHLLLFGYVYPHCRAALPDWILQEMIHRLHAEQDQQPHTGPTCFGTMLSREQYLPDTHLWGYRDARLPPFGTMTPSQIGLWTDAIGKDDPNEGHSNNGRRGRQYGTTGLEF